MHAHPAIGRKSAESGAIANDPEYNFQLILPALTYMHRVAVKSEAGHVF